MITLIRSKDFNSSLEEIGCTKTSYPLFIQKSKILLIKITDIDFKEATILKQSFLSAGGDVALHKNVLDHSIKKSSVLLMGTQKTYKVALQSLSQQPYFNIPKICSSISNFLSIIRIKEQNPFPKLMGILNITPDSFSDGGQLNSIQKILQKTENLIKDGADILDIGGESTRPGADSVSQKKEMARVLPVIKQIKKEFPSIPLSIDTQKSSIAKICIEEGVSMVNCVKVSNDMFDIIAHYPNIKFVVMHMRGNPITMQNKTLYTSIVKNIHEYFEDILKQASSMSISFERIILDPGIGFAKTPLQNLKIMREISSLFDLNCKILVGHSRKSFFKHTMNIELEDRDIPTAVLSSFLWKQGVDILRVHNVKATKIAITASNIM